MSGKPAETTPLYRAWSKGIRTEVGEPSYSASWVISRRGWLKIFADRIEHGGTTIHAVEVEDAVLYEARQWFVVPVSILSVATKESAWQFGLNPWTNVGPHLPFTFRRERIRLGHSRFSLILRVAMAGWLALLAYRQLAG